jgi:site-specific recombinase XerD
MTELTITPGSLVPARLPGDDQVSDSTAALIRAGLTESTEQKYAGDWKRFSGWCVENFRSPMPATPETLAEYVSHLVACEKAPNTIQRALATISVMHRRSGRKAPDPEGAKKALKGYRKLRAEAGLTNNNPARVVHPEDLRAVNAALLSANASATGKYAAIRDRAIFLLGWAGMRRRDEMGDLWIHDVRIARGRGMVIHIRKSKTDQDAEGKYVGVPYASDPEICPVRAMEAWLKLLAECGITEGLLLRRIDLRGRVAGAPGATLAGRGAPDGRLTGKAIWTIIRTAGIGADLEGGISPHGLRAGGATAAAAAGIPTLQITRHGGWADGSTTALGYIRDEDPLANSAMEGVL